MKRRCKYLKPDPAKKIWSRLDPKQYKRLTSIVEKYGFKSEYQIMQYITAAFLRVADPDNDENEEPVPDEIRDMFYDLSEGERHFEFVKPKRKLPQHEIDEQQRQLRLW